MYHNHTRFVAADVSERLSQSSIAALLYVFVCVVFMTLITATVLFARSQDNLLPVSMRWLHVVYSTTGFTGGGEQCHKTREIAAMLRGIQEGSHSNTGVDCLRRYICRTSIESYDQGNVAAAKPECDA